MRRVPEDVISPQRHEEHRESQAMIFSGQEAQHKVAFSAQRASWMGEILVNEILQLKHTFRARR